MNTKQMFEGLAKGINMPSNVGRNIKKTAKGVIKGAIAGAVGNKLIQEGVLGKRPIQRLGEGSVQGAAKLGLKVISKGIYTNQKLVPAVKGAALSEKAKEVLEKIKRSETPTQRFQKEDPKGFSSFKKANPNLEYTQEDEDHFRNTMKQKSMRKPGTYKTLKGSYKVNNL